MEDLELDDLELPTGEELEQQGSTEEQSQQQPQTPAAPGADDIDLEVENDEAYTRKNWNVDPVSNATKPGDEAMPEKVKARIGQLRASLTEAGRQRDNHARDNQELLRYAQSLKAQLDEANKQLSGSKVTTLKTQVEREEAIASSAKKELADAINTGNTAAMLDAQERFNRSNAKAELLRSQADAAEKTPVPQVQGPVVRQPQQQQQVQVSTEKRDQWMDKNKWFKMDEFGIPENLESATAIRAHSQALASGMQEGSDAYFQHIDNTVKAKHPTLYQSAAAASPVTPSSRVASGQQANTGARQKVKIMPETIRLAKSLGLTSDEDIKLFALNQARSIRQGS